jgi:membrane associated rhomboid family serine protease
MEFNLTTIIIGACVAASFYAWQNPDIMAKWMLNPYTVKRNNEYSRFVTSGFIHADYIHLFFNMFALLGFGGFLESAFKYQYGTQTGGILYLLLFVVGVIVSDLPTYFKNKDNYHYNSLGASGGVSSILFACIILKPWMTITIYFAIDMKAIFFAILYVIYSIYMGKKGYDNINHSAHLYGALFGVAFMFLTYPNALSTFINQIVNWKEFM